MGGLHGSQAGSSKRLSQQGTPVRILNGLRDSLQRTRVGFLYMDTPLHGYLAHKKQTPPLGPP